MNPTSSLPFSLSVQPLTYLRHQLTLTLVAIQFDRHIRTVNGDREVTDDQFFSMLVDASNTSPDHDVGITVLVPAEGRSCQFSHASRWQMRRCHAREQHKRRVICTWGCGD